MTLDIPKDRQTNISNLLSAERDEENYLFEYVRLVFSNPDLTVKEYQENQLLEPTINEWISRYFTTYEDVEVECRRLGYAFMNAVGVTNKHNWFLMGDDMDSRIAHSMRNHFMLTEEWIPIINSWYVLFRPYFVADNNKDDGAVGSYYWAQQTGESIKLSLTAETADWWYRTFRESVDSDGDPYLTYGMQSMIDKTPFMPLDCIVDFNKTKDSDFDDVLRYNRNLQTFEDFKQLGRIIDTDGDSIFTDFKQNRLDFDYYLMNHAANPALLEQIFTNNAYEKNWDYLSLCQTTDYAFMEKHGALEWLRELCEGGNLFPKIGNFLVNPQLTDSQMKNLCKETFRDAKDFDWEQEAKALGLFPLTYLEKLYDDFDNSNNYGFQPNYNSTLLAYLSNPNLKLEYFNSTLDFNFLTGGVSEDLLECPNQPASPFYFLSTSTFTNPVFTRRDLLSFLDYWKEVIDLGVALSDEIANRPFEEAAIRSLGVVREIEREYDLEEWYSLSDSFNAHGYMLTGLFHAENLTVQDLVDYLDWDEQKHSESNPLHQFYLLANPNIFDNPSVGLFNWWGSVVR